MRILVTGSEGNIGSRLVPYLKKCGHEVFCVDIRQKFEDNYMLSDITNPIDIISAFNKFKPEIVIHLAAMVSRITCEKSPSLCITTNVSGTNNIVQLCKEYNCKIIFFSTSEVYGNISGILSEDRTDINPNNLYGLSKFLGEKLVKYEVENNNLKALIVRPFMFYDEYETMGVHRSAMIRFAENLVKGNKITVHKNSARSWMHINDAINILEKLLYVDKFSVVNIGNPNVITMEEFARKMCDHLNISYEDHVIEEELPNKMTLLKYPDLTNQYKLTGFNDFYNLDDGLKIIIETIKKRIDEK